VDFLKRRGAADADASYLGIIQRNTELLSRTISDFLDYSKIETGRLELACETLDLGTVAAEVIANLEPTLARKAITVHLTETTAQPVRADRHRIGQVFTNLLANAVRFSPAGGAIDVSFERTEDALVTRVSDQGPGIPVRHQEAIFRKFYQIPRSDEGNTTQKGSAGIGLAICKGIVDAHGGRIWVESAPGEGSCFCVVLPLQGPLPLQSTGGP
ncbi:MAG: HAMP domain-containing sensor histidine kinase, partial [Desulfosarcinaceae bacterium]